MIALSIKVVKVNFGEVLLYLFGGQTLCSFCEELALILILVLRRPSRRFSVCTGNFWFSPLL